MARDADADLNNNERGIQMASDGSIPNKELWAKVWDAASKTKIPASNAEALAEAMAGRLTALPPGKPKDATLDEYVRAFNADTAVNCCCRSPSRSPMWSGSRPSLSSRLSWNNDHARGISNSCDSPSSRPSASGGG